MVANCDLHVLKPELAEAARMRLFLEVRPIKRRGESVVRTRLGFTEVGITKGLLSGSHLGQEDARVLVLDLGVVLSTSSPSVHYGLEIAPWLLWDKAV